MTFKQMLDDMILNGYVSVHKGKPVFTDKARAELDQQKLALQSVTVPMVSAADIETQYKEFILFCKVPVKGYDSYGRQYQLNKFSKDGLEAFKQAIKKGCNLQILALAVHLYYKAPGAFKKTVGNYMASGEWQTDYDVLFEQHKTGTLREHLNTTSHGTTNWFTSD